METGNRQQATGPPAGEAGNRQSRASAAPAASVAAWFPADCLGKRGLPSVRADLDALVEDLCCRVRAAGEKGLRGRQLAAELCLSGGTRALRLLCRYAIYAKGETSIIGLPGTGYKWSENCPGAAARMAKHSRSMGLRWLGRSSAYKRACTGRQLQLEFR